VRVNTVLITGTKGFTDETLVRKQVERVPAGWTIVTGNTRDVDRWVRAAAHDRGVTVRVIPTKWDVHSVECNCLPDASHCRLAGYHAAKTMVENAECIIVFDDGEDLAGRIVIDLAGRAGRAGSAGRRHLRIISMQGTSRRELAVLQCRSCGKTGFALPYKPSVGRPVYCGDCYPRKRLERDTSEPAFMGYTDATEILLPDMGEYRGEKLDYPPMADWSEWDTWEPMDPQAIKRTLKDIYYPPAN